MDFSFHRTYRGPVKAVILDWAGTTVDYGCIAPAAVFVQVFKNNGMEITMEQARGPMGLMKRDHIRTILQLEPVGQAWQQAHNQAFTEADVESIYEQFIPLQMAVLDDYADPIPGTLELMKALRQRGIRIGSTTGYNREMMEKLAPEAKRRGYEPDYWVCSTDVPAGRPYPWMMYKNAMELGVYPPEAIVKIGDTLPDIDEGLNAGAWTVGLTQCGNEVGLSVAEVSQLAPEVLKNKLDTVSKKMYQAGAHYVAAGPQACETIIDDINQRLTHGERP
jgi:phosphonoacetaldehyde hydrolase